MRCIEGSIQSLGRIGGIPRVMRVCASDVPRIARRSPLGAWQILTTSTLSGKSGVKVVTSSAIKQAAKATGFAARHLAAESNRRMPSHVRDWFATTPGLSLAAPLGDYPTNLFRCHVDADRCDEDGKAGP